MKYIQNKIAESRLTLPAAMLYGTAVWMAGGLLQQQWWVQFGCFAATVLCLSILNNANLLIRVYSKIISVSFIFLFCSAPFLFPSAEGALSQLSIAASLLILYRAYQDPDAVGTVFYTFAILGIGTVFNPYLFCYVPFFWVMMLSFVFSTGLRSFIASLLGLIAPYWFLLGWILGMEGGQFGPWLEHYHCLGQLGESVGTIAMSFRQQLLLGLTVILSLTGIIHFIRTSYHDKIRVRQIYYSFMFLQATAITLLLLFPPLYDLSMRIVIITTSPIIGHFIALTNTKVTNIAFFVISGAILLLTFFNLWA